MKQIVQNVRSGELSVSSTVAPMVQPGCVLIAARTSLISAGTEKAVRELAQKSLLAKARSRPDHLRRVLEKARNEGIRATLEQVREKLDQPMPMGYCNAGVVIATGEGVQEFQPGDRVASNGPHAEVVCIPKHLCARVPDAVPFEQAAFTVLGAIAMQGVRLAQVSIGETAFVIGLGLVGQLTLALLRAAGVRVIGTDLDPGKCELAKRLGAAEARPGMSAADVEHMTHGLGADAVLVTASTASSGPANLGAHAVRRKGRVVSVGVVGLDMERAPLFLKEAELVVSCSYGPGRYDPRYEERGEDYPAAYVRWTEQRNMQSVLDLMADRQLDVTPLISHRFSIDQAGAAYELIESGNEPVLGVVLEYPERAEPIRRTMQLTPHTPTSREEIGIGCLGAGNFARAVLLPKLAKLPHVRLESLCSSGGLTATHTAKKLGFAAATSNEVDVLENDRVDATLILTRHNQHARQVIRGLEAGRHVFVEKPLCLSVDELLEIEAAVTSRDRLLMVGFNRRFSPAALAVKQFFSRTAAPLTVSIRFNAGAVPADHWLQDERIGGGRIVGEACHAIDLATYLTGSPVTRVFCQSIGGPSAPEISDDQSFITLQHADGSASNVAYLAGGDKAFSKERVEVFGGGNVAVIDDFRLAEGWSRGKRTRLWKGAQDKGHSAELAAFVQSIRTGGDAPISWDDLRSTTLASLLALRSLREGRPLSLNGSNESVEEPRTLNRAG